MGKRANNEGTIFQLPDGSWCGFVSLGYRNGKRWRKKFKAKTQREVKDKIAEARQHKAKGGSFDNDNLTVEAFLNSWLEVSVKNSVRPRTFDSYSDLVKLYLNPRIGKFKLAKLEPHHVRTCLTDLLEKGGTDRKKVGDEFQIVPAPLSPRTVQYCRAVLRKALNEAVKDGRVMRNAAALTDPPKSEHHEIQPLSAQQARAFLHAVTGDRLEALFTVAVALGMRQGEILGLHWKDVNLDEGTLFVRYQLQRIKGAIRFVEPKTKRSRRTIKLPGVAISAMHAHRKAQAQERELAGNRWQDWGLVFTTPIGTPIESCNLNHRFQKLMALAQLPKVRFHDLRHTAATLLLAQGVHPRLVMEILGHSSISLTMNTYSHVLPTMQDEVAAKIDVILRPTAESSTPASSAAEMNDCESVATRLATQPSKELVQ